MPPQVTLVIPVHNCLPYLNDTLASAYFQSMPRDQFEVVAVDDGSTDGSSEVLAEWAARWPQLRVRTIPHSGSASVPRNLGIEEARGEYVFFLDGDDCLGPEALERLVGYARLHGSEVVLGRLVGIGRHVPTGIFDRDEPHAELDSGIYYSLLPFKLIRRSLLLERGIRFPEHVRISEDQPFIARCYLAAKEASVLASYPCYYMVRREGRSNTSFEGLPYATMLAQTDELVTLVTDDLKSGPVLAHLISRHVRVELLGRIKQQISRLSREDQEDLVATASPYAQKWDVPGLDEELTVGERLLVRALRSQDRDRSVATVDWLSHGGRARVIAVDGGWFLMGPGYEQGLHPRSVYRLPGPPRGVTATTDAHLEGTTLTTSGHACIAGIPASLCEIDVYLEHVNHGARRRMKVERVEAPYVNALMGATGVSYARAGFRATAELNALDMTRGRWRLVVAVSTAELSVTQTITIPTAFRPSRSRWAGSDGAVTAASLRDGMKGNVVLDVRRETAEPEGASKVLPRQWRWPARRTRT